MKYFITFLLEPVSYLVFALSISWHSRKSDLKYKILAFYFLVASLLLLKAIFLSENTSNLKIHDTLCLLTSVGFSFYFFRTFHSFEKRLVTMLLLGVQIMYYILSNVIFENNLQFDSMAYVILSTSMVFTVFMYVSQLLENVTDEPLSMNFDFWFIASQLIYFLGSFIIFLCFDYLIRKILPIENNGGNNRRILDWLWGVHNVLLFLSSLLTAGSVLWIASHKKSPSS